ncbi:MAG: prepilin peptidase [Bryobacteraceae bacterium]|nr:prepilin peptidase [Bryobacteraceae bacterium]
MSAELAVAVAVGVAAVAEDLARRTISDWTALAALAGGLCCQIAGRGLYGAGMAVLGALAGFGIFYVLHRFCERGGGDVALMAGFGALLGIGRVLSAVFWISVIGALIASAVMFVAAVRRTKPVPRAIPYAPAIALGVWIALMQES